MMGNSSKPDPWNPVVIYCCGCQADIPARLTSGREIYPHRPELAHIPFMICDTCHNHVGCHHKLSGDGRTKPLGVIPTPDLRRARKEIHEILDPLWKYPRRLPGGKFARMGGPNGTKLGPDLSKNRSHIYREIANRLRYPGGKEYHTAEIRTIEEAREVYRVVREIAREIGS
jgi:hypothetical protein